MSNARSCPFCSLVDDHTDNCYFTLKLEGATIGVIQAAWNRRAPVSDPQQSAQRASVDTPRPWKVLADDDKPDSTRPLDVILKNGVCLMDRQYNKIDWTQVADWRYSAAPSPAPQGEQA